MKTGKYIFTGLAIVAAMMIGCTLEGCGVNPTRQATDGAGTTTQEHLEADDTGKQEKDTKASNNNNTNDNKQEKKPEVAVKVEVEKPTTDNKQKEDSETETGKEVIDKKQTFIDSCSEIPYDKLARNPDKYRGDKIVITVKVAQVIQQGDSRKVAFYRANTKGDFGWYEDEYVLFDTRADDDTRILQDDILKIYGVYDGTEGVTRALTSLTEYVPRVNMVYVDILDMEDEGEEGAEEDLYQDKTQVDNCGIEETVSIKCLRVTFDDWGEFRSDNEYRQPADGYKYVYITCTFENTDKSDDIDISYFDFDCYVDGYGGARASTYEDDELGVEKLSPGRKLTRSVYFQVPEGANNIEFEYKPNIYLHNYKDVYQWRVIFSDN